MAVENMSLDEVQKRAQELAQFAYEGKTDMEVAKQGVHLNWLLLSTLLSEVAMLRKEISEIKK